MKRTTISLPEDLAEALEHEARRRRLSVSAVVREAVRAMLLGEGRRRLAFAGVCEDPRVPAAAEMERELEGLGDELDRRG